MSQDPANPSGPTPASGSAPGSSGRPPIAVGGYAPPPPPPGAGGYGPPPWGPPRRRRVWPWLVGLALVLAIGFVILLSVAGVLFALGVVPSDGPQMVENTYANPHGDATRRVVIVPIKGLIDDSEADFIHRCVTYLRGEKKPVAIVLRVDSPGGFVGASDRIWHDLVQYKEEEHVPVIASYGTIATSGGYYASCMADWIVAEPTTITGSIGVIADMFNADQLLKKVGVQATVLTAAKSPKKDFANNPFRAWEQKDTDAVQPFLDSAYDRFFQRVLEGRKKVVKGLTDADIKAAATGEAMTAQQAKDMKLVDAEGYLEDAITKAIENAQAANTLSSGVTPKVVIIGDQPTLRNLLGVQQQQAISPTADLPDLGRKVIQEMETPRLEYRWRPAP